MRRPLSLHLLVVVLASLGLGGLYGGIAMLIDLSGRLLEMSEVLPLLPVPNYFLPGLFLVIVMGVIPLGLMYALLARPRWTWARILYPRTGRYWAWYGTVTVGVLLVLWLSLQGLFIGFRWPMQYATGSMALSIVLLAFTPSVREFYTDSHEARRGINRDNPKS